MSFNHFIEFKLGIRTESSIEAIFKMVFLLGITDLLFPVILSGDYCIPAKTKEGVLASDNRIIFPRVFSSDNRKSQLPSFAVIEPLKLPQHNSRD